MNAVEVTLEPVDIPGADLAVTNAYILYKHFTSLNVGTAKSFHADLAKSFIGE